jgi:hypothetical protein
MTRKSQTPDLTITLRGAMLGVVPSLSQLKAALIVAVEFVGPCITTNGQNSKYNLSIKIKGISVFKT